MPNLEEITVAVKHSTRNHASAHETGEILREKFREEKDAKNRAYAFILFKGLLSEYSSFSRRTRRIDPESLCLAILSNASACSNNR